MKTHEHGKTLEYFGVCWIDSQTFTWPQGYYMNTHHLRFGSSNKGVFRTCKKTFSRFTTLNIRQMTLRSLIITFEIQSAVVVLDIDCSVDRKWVLTMINGPLLIRESVVVFLWFQKYGYTETKISMAIFFLHISLLGRKLPASNA